ncbi:MAG TPA: Hpt domain-containing protein [Nitrospira sp.]|uniref:Hpt domain-containing protein n=1 Tax=Accumulibacter sp. TaxID=2053492 RepID=UPI002BB536C8|nr:Hpt domain-containing protein [Accumulibacter sp.]HMU31910.1 Hpt domain-containing protein [Nitrospira sp.]HMW57476.1 Hpt domain-containing protein [Accumulibacter sp.]HNC84777.1 Hpt domain-containing protein [Nitrospira sp.]
MPDRYVRLLHRFLETHAADPRHLEEELALDRRDDAARRLHRMKGAAATLGLQAIASEAADLEALLRQSPDGPADAHALHERTDHLAALLLALGQVVSGPGSSQGT